VTCTVHTRRPNRGIGRQKCNRACDYNFLPVLFVVSIPQKWIFFVKLDKDSKRGNAPSVSTVSASLSASFSVILKQGAMEAGL